MKKIFLLTILWFSICATLQAQPSWIKRIGGNVASGGYKVKQTFDGGFIIGAESEMTATPLDWDLYLIKTDSAGTVQWSKTYGDTTYEDLVTVLQTSDSGYVLLGDSHHSGSAQVAYVVKTDKMGNVQWSNTYKVPTTVYCIAQTADSGFAITCEDYLIKVDKSGSLMWTRTLRINDVNQTCQAKCIRQNNNHELILAGELFLDSIEGNFIMKTDSAGNTIWTKIYKLGISSTIYCVQLTTDGGYLLAGEQETGLVSEAYYITKTDSDGNVQWSKCYPGLDLDPYTESILQQTIDSGYVFTGNAGAGAFIGKIDTAGSVQWINQIAATFLTSVCQTNDSGFAVTGWIPDQGHHHNLLFVKTDKDGLTKCPDLDTVTTLEIIDTTVMYNVFVQDSFITIYDSLPNTIVRAGGLDSTTCGPNTVSEINSVTGLTVFPNPSADVVNVFFYSDQVQNGELSVSDLFGRTIIQEELKISGGEIQIHIPLNDFSRGIYFVRLKLENGLAVRKIVKE